MALHLFDHVLSQLFEQLVVVDRVCQRCQFPLDEELSYLDVCFFAQQSVRVIYNLSVVILEQFIVLNMDFKLRFVNIEIIAVECFFDLSVKPRYQRVNNVVTSFFFNGFA